MDWFSGFLVYVLVWWILWFMMLPIGLVTQGESGKEITKGTPHSAPAETKLWMKVLVTSGLSAVVWFIIFFFLAP